MHPYATDSSERKYVPLVLAGLAIGAAWGFSRLLLFLNVPVAWWIDAPSTMGFYGIFYALFDKKLWEIRLLRKLGVVKVPLLEGDWQGTLSTSFDEHAAKHHVEVQIKQSWTRIVLYLRGRDSKSHTLAATLLIESPEGIVLSYQYRNEPLPHAVGTMQIHYGTARLALSDSDVLEGDYYSGRGRQNFGSLHLERRLS
ncbi:MAG: hypothetical protein HY647_05530 [Acidobacteria bacterium]|nr:hypothetical protein [Acidobacteriota bacterium]